MAAEIKNFSAPFTHFLGDAPKLKAPSGGTICPSSCVLFGVLCLNYTRDFHARVADEVVDHSEPAEKFSFVKRLATEKEPDGVLNFLVLDPGEVSFLCFFVELFEARDAFDNKPETAQQQRR